MSVSWSVGVSTVIERIHPLVVPSERVSRSALVDSRVRAISHRFLCTRLCSACCGLVGRFALSARARRRTVWGIDGTAGAPCAIRRLRVQFVGTLQFAFVLEALCLHSFLALRCFRVQLLGFRRLTISLSGPNVGISFCPLCLCPLFLDFGLSGTNIMLGLGSILPNLCGLFPLMFALLCCRLAADCDDDPHDDQDDDDGDDDPDDG